MAQPAARSNPPPSSPERLDTATRFDPRLLYRAARLYYIQDATQAEIAVILETSRPTVSRLLAEARATGIVHIEVRDPDQVSTAELAGELVGALGLRAAYVMPNSNATGRGMLLAAGVSQALVEASIQAGDALLVSSGATVHAIAQHPLPSLPGVLVAPTVGGVDEPREYYQTNEITRTIAVKVHGNPILLYAPLQPSPRLFRVLTQDEGTRRVTSLWSTARVALMGIGGPPRSRESRPSVLARDDMTLASAVGDICARPFDGTGQPLSFPGSDRLIAMELDDLTRIPHSIGVAVGEEKIPAILAATGAGWINTLVTDVVTAQGLIEEVRRPSGRAT